MGANSPSIALWLSATREEIDIAVEFGGDSSGIPAAW
jgi:hypothetical protein